MVKGFSLLQEKTVIFAGKPCFHHSISLLVSFSTLFGVAVYICTYDFMPQLLFVFYASKIQAYSQEICNRWWFYTVSTRGFKTITGKNAYNLNSAQSSFPTKVTLKCVLSTWVKRFRLRKIWRFCYGQLTKLKLFFWIGRATKDSFPV